MSEAYNYGAFEPESEENDPPAVVEYEVNGITFSFEHHNTVLWHFVIGDGIYDHIRHTVAEDEELTMFISSEQAVELANELYRKDFPYNRRTKLDTYTIERFSALDAQSIPDAIDESFGRM